VERLDCEKGKKNAWLLAGLMWLLILQNPLQNVSHAFSYVDELVALFGFLLGANRTVEKILSGEWGKLTWDKLLVRLAVAVFLGAGLLGNLLYRYQPLKCVVIDLYTNLKFFTAIGTGYFLFRSTSWDSLKRVAVLHAKAAVTVLFCIFLADRFVDLYPAEVRYGIKSAMLFYQHPTYLAGAMVFLIMLLTVFYEKKNLPCIAMALVLLFFTLRAKSMAAAAAYVAIFLFFAVFKLKLRLWHVIVLGVACIAIAWPKIHFYFIELAEWSARSVMMLTSFRIMKEYFPIGTGFGTYASAEAAKHYSPVYLKYGFQNNFELRDVHDIENTMRLIREEGWLMEWYLEDPSVVYAEPYLNDHFWPIIFGQTGFLGTIAFLVLLGFLVWRCLHVNTLNLYAYTGVLFAVVYLLISSMAEPAFHNAVAVPLALVMGISFQKMDEKTIESDKGEQICLKKN